MKEDEVEQRLTIARGEAAARLGVRRENASDVREWDLQLMRLTARVLAEALTDLFEGTSFGYNRFPPKTPALTRSERRRRDKHPPGQRPLS